MIKESTYLHFGDKSFRRPFNLLYFVSYRDLFMVDVVIPTLTADINMLATISRMPLDLLDDVVIGLRRIGCPGLPLLTARLLPSPEPWRQVDHPAACSG